MGQYYLSMKMCLQWQRQSKIHIRTLQMFEKHSANEQKGYSSDLKILNECIYFCSVHWGYGFSVPVRYLLSSHKTDSGLTQAIVSVSAPVFTCVGILEASVVVMFGTCSIMMCGKGFFMFNILSWMCEVWLKFIVFARFLKLPRSTCLYKDQEDIKCVVLKETYMSVWGSGLCRSLVDNNFENKFLTIRPCYKGGSD